MSILIDVQNLGRSFGDIKAVDGVTFQVAKGDVLGFLGPNGAGKSTTMKMLTSFIAPSFGKATVGGFDVVEQSREARSLIGYLPENAPLYGEMKVGPFLRFVAEMRGIPAQKRNGAIEQVTHSTFLDRVLDQRIDTLSKGFRRRVGLAQALIHDPPVLILDEPTDGLDPNQKHEVRTLISNMAKEKCIVLSTHILEEVDAVCTRAIIIAGGKIVADSTPDELRKRSQSYGALTVSFRADPGAEVVNELGAITGVRSVAQVKVAGGRTLYTLLPDGKGDIVEAAIRAADAKRWQFSTFYVDSGQLDEVFRSITT
jgi:ABC-2 type transport system ATP-binding protein